MYDMKPRVLSRSVFISYFGFAGEETERRHRDAGEQQQRSAPQRQSTAGEHSFPAGKTSKYADSSS